MIKTNLIGKVPDINQQLPIEHIQINDQGNILLLIQISETVGQIFDKVIIKVYYKKEQQYQEIAHNIELPKYMYYFQSKIWQSSDPTIYYFTIVSKRNEKIFIIVNQLDLKSNVITNIMQQDNLKEFIIDLSNQLIQLDYDGELRISSIDQSINRIFSNVQNIYFEEFKDLKILVLELEHGVQHYVWPGLEQIDYNVANRLNPRMRYLFLRVTREGNNKLQEVWNRRRKILYNMKSFFFMQPTQIDTNIVLNGMILQMRSKQKILRRITQTRAQELFNNQVVIQKLTNGQDTLLTFTDITTGKNQQILYQHSLHILNKILIEVRQQELWVYSLELNN